MDSNATDLIFGQRDGLASAKLGVVFALHAASLALLFAMAHRKVVLEASPGLGIGDVSKACGAAWKGMSDSDKQEWKDKALVAKQEIEVN